MYRLDITRAVDRTLKRLQPKQFRQVVQTILKLRLNPYPPDSKKLIGGPEYYRVDIGEFRIIYRVEDDVIKIALAGKRNDNDVYRRFDNLP